jgi:hypothetical protein
MSIMVTEVYDALREAGASEDRSRRAAEVLANYDHEFVDICGDLKLMKWMLGAIFAGVVALILHSFVHS